MEKSKWLYCVDTKSLKNIKNWFGLGFKRYNWSKQNFEFLLPSFWVSKQGPNDLQTKVVHLLRYENVSPPSCPSYPTCPACIHLVQCYRKWTHVLSSMFHMWLYFSPCSSLCLFRVQNVTSCPNFPSDGFSVPTWQFSLTFVQVTTWANWSAYFTAAC